MKDFEELKLEMCKIGKRLYEKGFVPGKSGNISAKKGDCVLITPAGFNLGDLCPENVAIINLKTGETFGKNAPSSERNMHFEIYEKRPEFNCIIHAHCAKATAFAIAGVELNMTLLAEGILSLGSIAIADYALPSSNELAKLTADKFLENDVVLMANHGIVIGHKNLLDAYYLVESLEMIAETILWTKLLGKANEISPPEMQKLYELKKALSP